MACRRVIRTLSVMSALSLVVACGKSSVTTENSLVVDDGSMSSTEVLVTSEAGDRLAVKPNVTFGPGKGTGTVIEVHPDRLRQEITGIGSSFTESSVFVLAHLEPEKRREVMRKIYSEEGANFSIARTTIAATDFSVEGKYSYAEVPGDKELKHFSIAVDEDGFSRTDYPGIADETFDLLPMIKEAQAIKAEQADSDLRIVASAWTAPSWMKDIEDWYVNPSADNNYQGTGGELKPQYVSTYADYLVRYLDAYAEQGVELWGLTPVNEPLGNSGHWESMHFSAETQNEFIKRHLGPKLQASDYGDTRLLIYDQNREELEHWADTILGDEESAQYVYGSAIHWYSSTYKVHEDVLDRVYRKYPDFAIVHTEGTIDNLGVPAPETGFGDPVGYQERDWFDNDAFWWNPTATDWAYTLQEDWANAEDHPIYTPVHRYARNIIVSLDNWVSGWIDWNVVLDAQGGPNHVGNFCGAPIMIDTESGQVYYTPIYYVLAQFSRTIRPGDTAVEVSKTLADLGADDLHASATVSDSGLLSVQVLNTTKAAIDYRLQIGGDFAEVVIPANALQTVRVQM